MTGFANGFQSGFGLMEAHLARQDQRAFRDKRAGLEDQRYQDQQARLDSNEAENARRYTLEQQRQLGLDDLNKQAKTAQIDAYKAQRQSSTNTDELTRLKIEDAKNNQTKRAGVDALLAFQADGEISDERLQAVQSAGLDPKVFGDREFTNHLKTASAVFSGKASYRSPEAIKAFNGLLKGQIERGIGEPSPTGGTVVSKQVKSIQLGDGKLFPADHFAVMLTVTDDKGNSWDAPLTMNRSSDPNDKVKTIPAEALMEHITGLQMLATDKTIGGALRALGHQMETGKYASAGDGIIYNQTTGESKQVGQPKVLMETLEGVTGEEQLVTSNDGGQTWNPAQIGQQGQQGQGDRSWEDRVNAVAQANNVDPAQAESEMLQDERFRPFAPAQPSFGGQQPQQPVGLADVDPAAIMDNLKGKDVSKMSLDERRDHDAFVAAQQAEVQKQKQVKREAKQRMAKLERMIKGMHKASANNPDNFGAQDARDVDPGQVQLIRAELEAIYENPAASKKDKEQAYKLIQQLPQ